MSAGHILICLVFILGAVVAALIYGIFILLVSDAKIKMIEDANDKKLLSIKKLTNDKLH